MSKASGVILVMAGMGLAASLVPFGSDAEQDVPQGGLIKGSAVGELRVSAIAEPKQSVESASATVVRKPQLALAATAAAQPSAPSAPVVVTLSHRPLPATAPSHKAAPIPRDREALTRELQKELRRVGCYDGEINAVWTPSTRMAMKAFTDRVNARLPIDNPDYILLSLVQGQQDKVCGKPCPTGQGLSQDGRCLPSAILAQAVRKGTPAAAAAAEQDGGQPTDRPERMITGWSTTTTAVARQLPPAPVPEGRMALAGPKTETTPPTAKQAPDQMPAVRSGDRRAGPRVAHPPRRGYDRGPSTYAQRSAPPRGGFVDSILRSRNSIF